MYLKQKGSGWETHCAVSAQKIQAFSEPRFSGWTLSGCMKELSFSDGERGKEGVHV